MCSSVAKGSEEVEIVEAPSIDLITLMLVGFSIAIGIWFVKSGQTLLPRRGYLDPAITPTMALLLCGAMYILAGIGSWWGFQYVSDESSTINVYAWTIGLSMITQIPILFLYAYFRRKCGSRHILPVFLIAYAVFVPIALAVAGLGHALLVGAGLEPAGGIGHEVLQQIKQAPWSGSTWIVIICVTIGAGIFEELLYRGLLLPSFAAVIGGKTVWRAIFATSLLFAIMHIGIAQPSAVVGLFFLSIGLCWARVKSGGILAPILIHVVFNAMNIAFVYSTTI
ncbi:MAG: CPBP family intramembrane metalloprotease [Phycisphaerae bacterium]|jgi:membrane protease YdiL (CAAX protease family)|nr:CPBP family intramembrane metalloprotease [Phycisphaerae bacterium]MBT6269567.1 CPBP family intramembrane metalloprotease [Phycisphaerae bacterium]MBT6283049.1 CPBP family intramembrane metalloprotease [Phycisphaerae bacterium]